LVEEPIPPMVAKGCQNTQLVKVGFNCAFAKVCQDMVFLFFE